MSEKKKFIQAIETNRDNLTDGLKFITKQQSVDDILQIAGVANDITANKEQFKKNTGLLAVYLLRRLLNLNFARTKISELCNDNKALFDRLVNEFTWLNFYLDLTDQVGELHAEIKGLGVPTEEDIEIAKSAAAEFGHAFDLESYKHGCMQRYRRLRANLIPELKEIVTIVMSEVGNDVEVMAEAYKVWHFLEFIDQLTSEG